MLPDFPRDFQGRVINKLTYHELKEQAEELEIYRKFYGLETEPTEANVLLEIEARKAEVNVIQCNPNPKKTLKFDRKNLTVIDGENKQ